MEQSPAHVPSQSDRAESTNTVASKFIMKNRLIHYSSRPLDEVVSVAQRGEPFGKPEGLWVSVGDAWRRYNWDRRGNAVNRLQFEACAYANHIRLTCEANLLFISNHDEFDRFNARYGRTWVNDNVPDGRVIDWTAVAEGCQGIVISPYLQDRAERPGGMWMPATIWYWRWACASGCIWGADAIADIVGEPVAGQEIHDPV